MDREANGKREHAAQQRRRGDRCQRTEDERNGDAEDGERQDLDKIAGEDEPVRCAQTFQGRDRGRLPADVVADRVPDPYTANQ